MESATQDILFVRTEVDSYDNNVYFFDALKAFKCQGHNTLCIFNSANPRKRVQEETEPGSFYKEVGLWIPRNVYGRFNNLMYIFRSLYTAVWAVFGIPDYSPSVVFVDANSIAIPILRLLGGYKVITFEYFQSLLSERHPAPVCCASKRRNIFHCIAMSLANDIIVPSKNARKSFLHAHRYLCERPVVFYPPTPAERWGNRENPRLPVTLRTGNMCILFLAIGIFDKRSNFAATVNSFNIYMSTSSPDVRRRVFLVVLGFMDWRNQEQIEYRNIIKNSVKTMEFREHINVMTNSCVDMRYWLYKKCHAVINATSGDEFNWYALEAQFFGRPLVAYRGGFAAEIIRNEINGYFIDQKPQSLIKFFKRFCEELHVSTFQLGFYGFTKYQRCYSYEMYALRLNNLLKKYTSTPVHEDLVEHLFDLN